MITKSAILKKANEEFPAHWEFLRTQNPRMRLPVRDTFPTVLSMTVGEITHDHGTEALITLLVQTEAGEQIQCTGCSLESHNDTTCDFSQAKEDRQFLESFAINLIFNLLCEEGLDIEKWESLSE